MSSGQSVRDWFDDNCRLSGNNKAVCKVGNEVKVLDLFEDDVFNRPATDANLDRLFDEFEDEQLSGEL